MRTVLPCSLAVIILAMAAPQARAELAPGDILNKLPASEIEAALPKEHPSSYYTYVARLTKAGDITGALRWYYIGQLRYRAYLQAHPEQDTRTFRKLNLSVGQGLIKYGALHQDQWLAAIDAALAWDDAHDNAFTPKDEFPDAYAMQRGGLARLKAYIVSNGPKLQLAASGARVDPRMLMAAPEVRRLSRADGLLFRDLLAQPGVVGFADNLSYPKATTRDVVKIEVLAPYEGGQQGVERWTVAHDGGTTAAYLVRLTPDGQGGTSFAVSRDR